MDDVFAKLGKKLFSSLDEDDCEELCEAIKKLKDKDEDKEEDNDKIKSAFG